MRLPAIAWNIRIAEALFLLSGLGLTISLVIDRTYLGISMESLVAPSVVATVFALLLTVCFVCDRDRVGLYAVALPVLALVCFFGLNVAAAVAFLAVSSIAIGSFFVRRNEGEHTGVTMLAVGMCVHGGVYGWLLPFPVHFEWVYISIGMLLIACRTKIVLATLQAAMYHLSAACKRKGSVVSLISIAIAMSIMPALLPLMYADDLAGHLRIGWDIHALGYYRLDPESQVWAMAPWLGDVVFSHVMTVSGGEPGAAVNLLWHGIALSGSYKLALQCGASRMMSALASLLYASVPLVGALLGSLQTETASTALLVVLALHIHRQGKGTLLLSEDLVVTAILVAGLAALKSFNAIHVLPLLVWLMLKVGFRLPLRRLPDAIFMALLIGGSSYVYSGILTGNPFLPLFNDVFASPFYGTERFHDQNWSQDFDFLTIWHVIFDTSRFHEGWDGAAGFSLALTIPLAILAIISPNNRGLALSAVTSFFLSLFIIPYVRYALPVTVLIFPVAVSAIGGISHASLARYILAACIVLNLAFQSTANYFLRGDAVLQVMSGRNAEVLARHVPERVINSYVRQYLKADERVFFATESRPYFSEVSSVAMGAAWYDFIHYKQLKNAYLDPTGKAWMSLMRDWGVTHVLTREDSPQLIQAALRDNGAVLQMSVGSTSLYKLKIRKNAWHVVSSDANALVLERGINRTAESLLSASVTLNCPDKRRSVVAGWKVFDQAGGLQYESYRWVECGLHDEVRDEIRIGLDDGRGRVVASFVPIEAGNLTPIELRAGGVVLRRDLMRQRDLGRLVRAGLTPRELVGGQ